jgi:superfamily II DNA or RNA helicase
MLSMEMGCIAGDTEIIVNRNGNAKRMLLRHFYRKFHGEASVWNGKPIKWAPSVTSRIRSLVAGELHLNHVVDVIAKGVQPVLKIQLASGKSIRVTPDHEIAAPNNQWIAASHLTPDTEVLTNGKIIDKDGYVRLYGMRSHPRRNKANQVYEHIVVMERVLGRPITRKEHVHHLNHIKHDNRPENLTVLPISEHHRKHGKEGGYLCLDKAPGVCFIPKIDTIVSVEPNGETDVYDIVMADPGRNFVANGIIVHNCGKSRVAIEAAIIHSLDEILIVCPRRVVEVWARQFRQYAPDYAFLALDDRIGSVATKLWRAREFLTWAEEHRKPAAIAINYDGARRPPFAKWALSRTWPLVILDESHKIKQNSGITSRFAGRLGLMAQYRLALSGTPMPHSPLDVWAQYRFLDRSVYDDTYTSFKARYAIMGGFHGKNTVGWRDLTTLREKFFSLAFQVGAEVLDLPGELDETYHTNLEAQGAKHYRAIEEDFITWLGEQSDTLTIKNALGKLLRLQQLTGGMLPDDSGGEHQVDSSKEKLLEDLLEDIDKDEPVVVFCRFRADLNAVWRTAMKLGRLTGELSGSQSDLNQWQRGDQRDPRILAVQIQAGGVGIDLTRARYAIYYSLGFSLADYLQSRARIRRPGQTRPVIYYHLIVRNTVDELVMRALERRQELVESVLQHYKAAKEEHVTN